jgi:hypothetical protein
MEWGVLFGASPAIGHQLVMPPLNRFIPMIRTNMITGAHCRRAARQYGIFSSNGVYPNILKKS